MNMCVNVWFYLALFFAKKNRCLFSFGAGIQNDPLRAFARSLLRFESNAVSFSTCIAPISQRVSLRVSGRVFDGFPVGFHGFPWVSAQINH